MSKFKTFGCLALLALLSGACGASPTGGNPAPNEGSDDAGFDPVSDPSGGDDAARTEDTSPSGDNVSPTSDAATSEDATPDDTGDPVHDSGATPPPGAKSDAGSSSSPPGSGSPSDAGAKLDGGGSKKDGGTGSGAAKDSGTAVDTGTVVVDTGTVVVDTGTTEDSGAAVDSAPPTPPPAPPPSADCSALAADVAARDALPESTLSASSWYTSSMQGTWGPAAATFPTVATPSGCDRVTFQRERVIAAAKHYTGLPYQHHHVPAWNPSSAWSGAEGVGLDCSNFTSWVYNFGLGIKFTSNVVDQSNTAGRLLSSSEPLQPGDLLYITTADGSAISHVVIYVDAGTIIDDTSSAPGVGLRAFAGWYKTRFSHARRVIE